tara:strand:+ start:592 stop:729 length:138 start_codon:yes stop_codon:yes gene_type:complete
METVKPLNKFHLIPKVRKTSFNSKQSQADKQMVLESILTGSSKST